MSTPVSELQRERAIGLLGTSFRHIAQAIERKQYELAATLAKACANIAPLLTSPEWNWSAILTYAGTDADLAEKFNEIRKPSS
jgi:hypothetical protein